MQSWERMLCHNNNIQYFESISIYLKLCVAGHFAKQLWINGKSGLVNLVLLPLWYADKDIIRDNISECHRRELWQSFNKRICRVVQCESKGFQSTVQRCHGYPFLHLQTCQDLCVVQGNSAGNGQPAAQSKLSELWQRVGYLGFVPVTYRFCEFEPKVAQAVRVCGNDRDFTLSLRLRKPLSECTERGFEWCHRLWNLILPDTIFRNKFDSHTLFVTSCN